MLVALDEGEDINTELETLSQDVGVLQRCFRRWSWIGFLGCAFFVAVIVQLKETKTKQFFAYLRLKIMYSLENTKKMNN